MRIRLHGNEFETFELEDFVAGVDSHISGPHTGSYPVKTIHSFFFDAEGGMLMCVTLRDGDKHLTKKTEESVISEGPERHESIEDDIPF